MIQDCKHQLSNTHTRIAAVQKLTSELDDSFSMLPLTANNAAVTELLNLAINRMNKVCERSSCSCAKSVTGTKVLWNENHRALRDDAEVNKEVHHF